MATDPNSLEEKRRAQRAAQPTGLGLTPRSAAAPSVPATSNAPTPTLASVANGGPGTVSVGGLRISHLPDYSNPPGAADAGNYDQMPPDRVRQEISGTPLPVQSGGQPGTAQQVIDSGLNVASGLGKLAVGGLGAVAAPVLDTARNGITRLAGGDPNTLPGGTSGFHNSAMQTLREGWQPIAAGGQQIGRGLLSALGAQSAGAGEEQGAQGGSQAQPQTPSRPASVTGTPSMDTGGANGAPTEQASTPAAQGNGFQQTGIGGIVGRRNSQGVMEFSNAQGDVAGAAGTRLVDGNMGDGIGGLSVGQAGDAQQAIERVDRANAERQRMVDASRGGLGDTGNFTVVGDNTRGSLFGQELEARRRRRDGTDQAIAENRLKARELNQNNANTQAELGLRQREVVNAEQTGALDRQKTQQEIQNNQLTLDQQQQVQAIRTRLADPSLPANERAQLERNYAALTTPAKDRYVLQDVVLGQDATGAPITGKAAVDVTTGQVVGQGLGLTNPQMQADLAQARRIVATDPSKRAEVEKRLQQAYSRGLEN